MATTPEGKVKAGVKNYLLSIGAYYAMPIGSAFGKAGVPDFLVCWRGKFFGIETKAPGKLKNTTVLQDIQLAAIQTAGGMSIVIDDWKQLKPLFESAA